MRQNPILILQARIMLISNNEHRKHTRDALFRVTILAK
jgi:hypothetical protein